MGNLFSGLEALGLGGLSKIGLYDDTAKKDDKQDVAKKEANQIKEEDFLFEKSYTCPVCDKEFKNKTVRTGRAKLLAVDTDFRAKYQGIDVIKYDAVVCPLCGYAALTRFFNVTTAPQRKFIREQISANFRGLKEPEGIYSYDDAILRYRLALVNTAVKHGKLSEKAYVCLKLAWLLRGKSETLPADTPNLEAVKAVLAKEELEFLGNAYMGFLEASSKENYPMCGMDEDTVMCLIADLARRIGKTDDAKRLLSRLITSRTANERIKNKARDLKELIQESEK